METIGSYQIEKLLATGGMGAVYLATHPARPKKVAIKILNPALTADRRYVSRFLDEAKIVQTAAHPNIVEIIELIEETAPRRIAYVMEYLEGPSLREVLATRPLDVKQAVNIQLQLVRALETVHALGVIHRDLKPDNLIIIEPLDTDLSRSPSIKILDFGIAKTTHTSSHRTATGATLGTPAYVAPEQVGGLPVSPATDVYALAEILYESLTTQPVFRGDQMQIMRSKLGGRPDVTLPPALAGKTDLEALLAAALNVEPETRPSLSTYGADLWKLHRSL